MSVDWDWLQGYNATPPPAPGTPAYQQNQAAVQSFLAGTTPPQQQQGQQGQQQQQQNQSDPTFAQRAKKAQAELKAFAPTRERIRNMPTPGGIGVLVLALLVMLFLIVPVNGKKTRANLLFDVGRGEARLDAIGTENDSMPTGDTTPAGLNTGTGSGPITPSPSTPAQVMPETSMVSPMMADYSPNGIPMPGVNIVG